MWRRLSLFMLLSLHGMDALLDDTFWRLAVWHPANRAAVAAPLPTVIPVPGLVTSRFGARRHPIWGGWMAHAGIDIANRTDALVRATQKGAVRMAGWQGGYGLAVEIDHGYGWRSRYGHLSTVHVLPGQLVRAGAIIGRVGMTGTATGPHLHFELRYHGMPIDPEPYLLPLARQ